MRRARYVAQIAVEQVAGEIVEHCALSISGWIWWLAMAVMMGHLRLVSCRTCISLTMRKLLQKTTLFVQRKRS